MSLRLSLAAVALGVGCLAPTDDVEVAATAQELGGHDEWGCPVWGCGSNSPIVDAVEFHDAHELGQIANAEGFVLTGFSPPNSSTTYRLDVELGQITAKSSRGALVASGFGVQGWRFGFKNTTTGAAYTVTIMEVAHSTKYWAYPNGGSPYAWTYKLGWLKSGAVGHPTPVCGNANGFSQDGLADFHAVVFEDDRIDAKSKRVTAETSDWFNIGCGGHALAKMHLMVHTKAANKVHNVWTTREQRTSLLKMFSGDYCGDGQPLTVAGEPLSWKDANGWFTNVQSFNGGAESIWTDAGAVCVTKPRIDFNQTQLGKATFPDGDGNADVYSIIQKRCPKPTCSTRGWYSQGHMLSVLKQ